MAEEEYVPHRKKAADKNSAWFYFLINKNKGDSAKCKRCSAILKTKGGSTKGLLTHLSKIHKIDLKILRSHTEVSEIDNLGPSTSSNNDRNGNFDAETAPLLKKHKITDFFISKNDKSFEAILARMTSVDGLPFRTFLSSTDLRELLEAKGYIVPKSAHTIKSKVIEYSKKIRSFSIQQMANIKGNNEKFSLTFDEWTSTSNKRYLNINVHSRNRLWNIGLVRIKKSMTSEVCVELLKERLSEHKLCLEKDIIGFTTDGASVMAKIQRLIPPMQQLCFAHGLQLAVIDTLYKKSVQVENVLIRDENSTDEDSDSDADDFNDPDLIFCNDSMIDLSSKFDVNSTIVRTRNIIRTFRKSPIKNDTLQKYVIEEHGREMQLILDCKTRWSSLFLMLERFIFLEDCIKKSMIDLKMEFLSASELQLLKNLVQLLEPIKLTVNVLCQRDANLCTADTALMFMMKEIGKMKSNLAELIKKTLESRIKERRTVFSGLIRYLHNPYDQNTDEIFNIPDKHILINEMEKLIKRLTSSESFDSETIEEDEEDDMPLNKIAENLIKTYSSTLKNKLQEAVLNSMKPPTPILKKGSLKATLRQEMGLYEDGGIRGRNLQLVYDFLLTIPPTSVEAERAFSAAGTFCTKIRSKLSDSALDELTFLRHYFKNSE